MSDGTNNPRAEDPRIPDKTYDEDASVRERNTSTPEATANRGTGGGSLRILLFIAVAVIIVFIVVLLSGAYDLGGDAPQGTDLNEPIPGMLTPETVP
ncbi:MAG: hypothetical protein H0V47_01145 [Chloroflexia bacterium]|nr:hypothetical protein [Chloroflexia bacterium]